MGEDVTFTPWMDSQTDEFVIVGDGVLLGYNGSDTDVVIPNGVKYIGDAFRDYIPLHTVTIPDSVTIIGALAFSGCNSMAEAIIPDSVIKISDSAFYNTPWLFDV